MKDPNQKSGAEHVAREAGLDQTERLDMLRELFPEAFAEGKVDWDKLRATLGEEVSDSPERYSFTWAGKRDAIRLLQMPSRATLVPAPDESVNWDTTKNAFIEGDNLEVLKLLLKPYYGRVKMIYVDPPYNTGNDFVYPDNYSDPLDTYLRLTGQKDSAGNLLTSNAESSGRYHSGWLSMMYPRLFLARQLLDDTGVLMVSIDDHEVHNLRLLLCEIFGDENFITCITWEKGRKNDSTFYSESVEYILMFARNKQELAAKGYWRERKPGIDDALEHYDKLRESLGSEHAQIEKAMQLFYRELDEENPTKKLKHFYRSDERGLYFGADISSASTSIPDYDIIHPVTGKPVKKPTRGWGCTEPEMQRRIAEDRVLFGSDESTIPLKKSYLREVDSLVKTPVIYKDGRAATLELKELLGGVYFDNPKDHEVLKELFRYAANRDSLVMDFFAGAASTAQAIYELNSEDGGTRSYICVQLPEPIQDNSPTGSRALKAGYKTIAEIGKERIRRVVKAVKTSNPAKLKLGEFSAPEDLGVRVYKLAASSYKPWMGVEDADADQYAEQLEAFADPLVEGWKPTSVIYEVANKEGFGLNQSIVKLDDVKSNEVFRVSDPDKGQSFLITLDAKLDPQTAKGLDLSKDDLFICRDSALTDEQAANLALQCRLKTV